MSRRRRRPGERWSAGFTMTLFRPGGHSETLDRELSDERLRKDLGGVAGRVQFRFRFEGRHVSPSVHLSGGPGAVVAFRNKLRLAIAEDWDLDGKQPVPPGTGASPAGGSVTEPPEPSPSAGLASAALPAVPPVPLPAALPAAATGDGAVPDNVIALRRAAGPEHAPSSAAGTPGLLGSGEPRYPELDGGPELLDTFEELALFFESEQASTTAKSKSSKRLPGTMRGIRNELAFADGYFRKRSVDGHPGASRRVNAPDEVDEDDCIDLLTTRNFTNLRTRSGNEAALRRWSDEVVRLAPDQAKPAAPIPAPEVAKDSTTKAMATQVAAAFELAEVERRISRSPWTARVRRRVVSPPPTHFSERGLPPLDAVHAAIDALGGLERTVVIDGKQQTATGERYRMLPRTLERVHPRPEEVIALRRSSCTHLRDPEPYLVFREAMVEVTLELSSTDSTLEVVPLKARSVGDERPVGVDRAFAGELLDHLERFVPPADQSSEDPDERDPLLFTTHTGAPIRLGYFRKHWWVPAVQAAAALHPQIAGLPLRMLRHVGISRRIAAGESIELIATEAGNSPDVIHRHYRGIIQGAERVHGRKHPAGPEPVLDLTGALAALAGAPLDELLDGVEALPAEVRDRVRRASGAVKGVLS